MSLDCAEIDLSKSFVEGMGYVALSRVKKIEGLRLMGLNDIALRINKEVSELDKKLLLFSEKAVDELGSFSENEVKKIQETFLNLVSPTKEEKQESLSTYEKTKLLIDEKNSLQEIADKREVTKETIVGHIEKLLESGEKIDIDYIKKGFEKNRLEKILKAFKKTKDKKLTPVKEILGDDFGFDEIRVARLFLE